jgi:YegS/Rv2252/BmrU family lipid kinase
MQPCVIFNPAAAYGGARKLWPRIESELRGAIGPYQLAETARPGHARDLARSAATDGARLVIAVGGDGTASEAIDGLIENDGTPPPGVSFGFVAIGTGNDYRRSLGLSGDFRDDIARLANGGERTVDIGRIAYLADDGRRATRHFINVAGFGLSGAMVRSLDRAVVPRLLGPRFMFFWGSVTTLVFYRFQNVQLSVDNIFSERLRVAVVAVAIGSHFGAGMKIAPDADPADGLFDVVIVRGDTKAHLIANMPKLYDGSHVNDRAVTVLRGRRVSATPLDAEAVLLEVDGDAPGRLPASFEILPGALRLRG